MPVIAPRGSKDDEFVELVHAAWPALYRTAVLLVRDHALAEDLVQSALAKTYSHWHRIRDTGAAQAYARRALVNTTTSTFRRKSYRSERPTAELPEKVGVPAGDPAERLDVRAALAELAPRQRAVVVLRFYDDLSVQDTADLLGISTGTVKSQTSAALDRLRVLLDVDVDVPRPDAVGIARQGRELRTRRRVGAAVLAAILVGAVGVGSVLVGNALDGSSRGAPPVTGQEDSAQTYDAWAAWSVNGEVTIGEKEVDLPGEGAYHLAQTSEGVVAQYLTDDGTAFALVTPDGGTTPLGIPGATPTVDGDPSAPHVAWVVTGDDEVTLHVWDVASDEELARVVVPSPGTRPIDGRQVIQPVDLDGDAAFLGTMEGEGRRVDWRTGAISNLPLLPVSVRDDVAAARDGDQWVVMDATTGTVLRRIDGDRLSATVSPDGDWLILVAADVNEVSVEPVAGGKRVRLEGIGPEATWSRDGSVVGQVGATPEVLRCSTAGDCERRSVPGDPDEFVSVLVADYLNVG